MHKQVKVESLIGRSSYHMPLLLSICLKEVRLNRQKKLFRFKACWTKESDCKTIIGNASSLCTQPMGRVKMALL